MQAYVPSHYLPAEYAAAPFSQRPRGPPHHAGGQYAGWAQMPQPHHQWGVMGPQRHAYAGPPPPFSQDFSSAQQHLQSQFGFSLPQQQMPKSYSGGMYGSSLGHQQTVGTTNPSVMILQRSTGSDSSAGK